VTALLGRHNPDTLWVSASLLSSENNCATLPTLESPSPHSPIHPRPDTVQVRDIKTETVVTRQKSHHIVISRQQYFSSEVKKKKKTLFIAGKLNLRDLLNKN
jgi:hypothetical protein